MKQVADMIKDPPERDDFTDDHLLGEHEESHHRHHIAHPETLAIDSEEDRYASLHAKKATDLQDVAKKVEKFTF